MKNILITGGSGLIGHLLTALLQQKGYTVGWLSRSHNIKSTANRLFKWDLENQQIDEEALDFADSIINLAGAGIADKSWTVSRKQEIINSRTEGIRLIYKNLKKKGKTLQSFVSASAIGYYGHKWNQLLTEEASPSNDFLGRCCIEWEKSVNEINELNIRTVKLRTGIVLTIKGGALPKLIKPIKLGFGAPLGSGQQWMSWIHINDLCNIYIHSMESENVQGAYNATAPKPVTNQQFTETAAEVAETSLWAPKVPEFMIKLILGELHHLVLDSAKCSSAKIQQTGFVFEYTDLRDALNNLLTPR